MEDCPWASGCGRMLWNPLMLKFKRSSTERNQLIPSELQQAAWNVWENSVCLPIITVQYGAIVFSHILSGSIEKPDGCLRLWSEGSRGGSWKATDRLKLPERERNIWIKSDKNLSAVLGETAASCKDVSHSVTPYSTGFSDQCPITITGDVFYFSVRHLTKKWNYLLCPPAFNVTAL